MTNLYEPPVSYVIAAALVVFGIWALARGARGVSAGLAGASALELVRGIRLAVFALVAGFFAIGLLVARPGFVTFGAIILAEEVYETGVLALLVRLGDRSAAERAEPTKRPGADLRADGRGHDYVSSTASHRAICSARSTSERPSIAS